MPIVPANSEGGTELVLSVSIVTFMPDMVVLEKTLESLAEAFAGFDRRQIKVFIVQNSDDAAVPLAAERILADYPFEILSGHGNIGFGRGHNLILSRTGHFHLILNPDVEMDKTALLKAVEFMNAHLECGLISPAASWPDGTPQYLCKRYPALFDLFLRGFAPNAIKRLFAKRLARYEMQSETTTSIFWDPPIVSGCFMFFRGEILRRVGGFNPKFFLYFEDFDLSIRVSEISQIAYVPAINIIHAGGHASRKGLAHIKRFVDASIIFYGIHGVKIL